MEFLFKCKNKNNENPHSIEVNLLLFVQNGFTSGCINAHFRVIQVYIESTSKRVLKSWNLNKSYFKYNNYIKGKILFLETNVLYHFGDNLNKLSKTIHH